jgi:hypothetical protein
MAFTAPIISLSMMPSSESMVAAGVTMVPAAGPVSAGGVCADSTSELMARTQQADRKRRFIKKPPRKAHSDYQSMVTGESQR